MGEGFWVLIFVFFVLAPILERVLKGGVNTRRPPGRVPGQRPMQRRPLPGQRVPPGPGMPTEGTGEGAAGDATDLIPADLWEILTGQRRIEPPPPPTPTPAPVATAPPPSYRETLPPGAVAPKKGRMAGQLEERRPGPLDEEAAATELLRRRDREWQAEHAPPAVVSMETEPLPEARRHAAYHDRLDHLSKPAEVQRGRGPIDLHLGGRSELRRAVLLQEVLGRPRGLDD